MVPLGEGFTKSITTTFLPIFAASCGNKEMVVNVQIFL